MVVDKGAAFVNYHEIEISSSLSNCLLETFVEVWETLKKLWKQSPVSSCSHSFSCSPKIPLVFYDSIETRYMFSISYFKIVYKSSRTAYFTGFWRQKKISVSLQNTVKVLTNVTWNGISSRVFFKLNTTTANDLPATTSINLLLRGASFRYDDNRRLNINIHIGNLQERQSVNIKNNTCHQYPL